MLESKQAFSNRLSLTGHPAEKSGVKLWLPVPLIGARGGAVLSNERCAIGRRRCPPPACLADQADGVAFWGKPESRILTRGETTDAFLSHNHTETRNNTFSF